MTGNGPPEFKVGYAQAVRAKLKLFADRARAAGHTSDFLAVLKTVDQELKLRARSFGEVLYTLKHARLEVRIGGRGFLQVRVGVHTERNVAIVIDCEVLGDPGF